MKVMNQKPSPSENHGVRRQNSCLTRLEQVLRLKLENAALDCYRKGETHYINGRHEQPTDKELHGIPQRIREQWIHSMTWQVYKK